MGAIGCAEEWTRRIRGAFARAVAWGTVLMVLVAGCGGASAATPTATSTQIVVISNRPSVTPSPSVARPSPTVAPTPTVAPGPTSVPIIRIIPTVPQADGNYVTSALPDAHYYYYYTDQRWKTISDRVWFYSLSDLLATFPDRKPAP